MKFMKYKIYLLVLVTFTLTAASSVYPAENRFKLKPGAEGAVCLNCHKNFQEKLKDRFVHTPVKIGECSGCHNPHTSKQGKLLDTVSNKICYKCHKKVIPDNPRSAHKLAVEGNCVKCHDPHSSNNKAVLLKAGNALCFDCHKDISDKIKSVRFKHRPVDEDCLSCHSAHASAQFVSLLKSEIPALCITCHKTDNPAFTRQHMNYPVASSRCNSCHDSHGSNRAVIMFDEVHAPVAEKKCAQCHNEPGSQSPLATKKQGVEMCRDCHNDMVNETFSKNRVHWPLLDRDSCLHCHNAHAAKQKKLLTGPVIDVCGKCHADTVELQHLSKDNPKNTKLCKPVKEGDCVSCHSPHSSDYVLLTAKPSMSFDICNKCHDWKTHSTHPVGEKIIDPRNKNLSVDCISCHRACGTGNKPAMSQFETVTETCIQCHKELERR
ncbi:MAG: cytochrome C [Nitrospirae bacterium]|nr:cytochrome C [Nitrospirota bacterium]